MSTSAFSYLTPEQYLEIERKAEFRSEYVHGEVLAMSGGTLNHAWIVANALSRLTDQLRGQSCGAVANDVRLFCALNDIFTYPDIIVTCGPHQFLDMRRDTITDATAIVEVL